MSAAPVPVPVAAPVRLSADRKVSSCVRRQGSKDTPALQNAYGLPAGLSCPDRTPFCDGCYAEALETQWSSVSRLVMGNYHAHVRAGDSVAMHVALLDRAVSDFVAQFGKLERAGRVSADDCIFRIHWDGDLFSETYTRAWARVITAYPSVQFWIYTRSFQWAPILSGIPNVAVYLSVDQYNLERARPYLEADTRLHAAFCADTQADAAALAERLQRRAVPCPENVGRIPLVMHRSGRRSVPVEIGTDGQGACSACRLCVDGVRDVAFAITKG